MRFHLVSDGLDLEPISLPERDTKFERVNRIKAQSVAKEGFLAVDILDTEILQFEHVNDECLDLLFEFIHEQAVP